MAVENPSCARAKKQDSVFFLVPTRREFMLFTNTLLYVRTCWSVHEHRLVLSNIDGWLTDDAYAEHSS